MDYYFFFYISEKCLQVRKNKSICQGKFLIQFIQVARSIYSGVVFQTMHTPQRYVHNLESDWKNSVCIGVKNFVNFYISKLYGRLH